jgi:hypothetical protein
MVDHALPVSSHLRAPTQPGTTKPGILSQAGQLATDPNRYLYETLQQNGPSGALGGVLQYAADSNRFVYDTAKNYGTAGSVVQLATNPGRYVYDSLNQSEHPGLLTHAAMAVASPKQFMYDWLGGSAKS